MPRHGDVLRELREPTGSWRHAIPESWAGFRGLHDGVMAPTAGARAGGDRQRATTIG